MFLLFLSYLSLYYLFHIKSFQYTNYWVFLSPPVPFCYCHIHSFKYFCLRLMLLKRRNRSLQGSVVFVMLLALSLFMAADEREYRPAAVKSKYIKIPRPAKTDPRLQGFIDRFEKQLEEAFEAANIPGAAVAIVLDSNIVFKKGFGLRKAGGKDPVDVHTTFRLASVSKGFASVLTGLQVDRDKLNWNDPLKKYLPGFRTNPSHFSDSVTIRHILSHSSGFPYQAYSTLVEDGIRRDVMFRRLQDIKLSRKPGEIHSYQNVAYSLIEPVLENIEACSFQDLLFDQIFRPLHMHDASITYEEMMATPNKAIPHQRYRKHYTPVKISSTYYNVAAAGGINASISDMTEWMKALLGQRPDVISTQVLDSVFKPVVRTRVRNSALSRFDSPRKGHYGMGWRVVEYPNDTIIYHGGYANGFKSELALDKNKRVGICILTNAPNSFSKKMVAEFFKAYKSCDYPADDQCEDEKIALNAFEKKEKIL